MAAWIKRLAPLLLCALCQGAWAAGGSVADAAMHADSAQLTKLVASGANVNAPQPDGSTALHWAAHHGDAVATKALLAAGANPSALTDTGITPLSLACEAGNPAVVKMLLDAGADANQALANGETPLMMAARTGNVPVMQGVGLAHGAKVDQREKLRGTTALMWAAANSNTRGRQFPDLQGRGCQRALGDRHTRSQAVSRRPGRERIEEFIDGTGLRGKAVEEEADTAPPVRGRNPKEQAAEGARWRRRSRRPRSAIVAFPTTAKWNQRRSQAVRRPHAADLCDPPGRPGDGEGAARMPAPM